MALANAMGWNNPFTEFVGNNRQTLMGLGAGIAGGRNFGQGLASGLAMAAQGKQADEAAVAQKQAEAERQQSMNQTLEYMRSKGFDDLVAGVESGGMKMDAAWSEALRRDQPQAPKPPIEVGGVLVDPVTFQPVFDSRQPEKPPAAPAGYQWNPDGTQSYIPGGPADPANLGKTTEAQRRNQQLASVIQPELASVEQNWEALADPGNQTWGSNPVTAGMASPEYQQARNSLSVIAQSYLYSVSGAAATDAEVQKIVDSVTPKPFESPQSIAAKKDRIRQMADAVIQAGGGVAPMQAPAGQTSSGLQWSLEP